MKEHHLKVYESPGADRTVPQIRLQGKWLSELGFEIGENIVVTYEDGRLIIKLDPTIPEKK